MGETSHNFSQKPLLYPPATKTLPQKPTTEGKDFCHLFLGQGPDNVSWCRWFSPLITYGWDFEARVSVICSNHCKAVLISVVPWMLSAPQDAVHSSFPPSGLQYKINATKFNACSSEEGKLFYYTKSLNSLILASQTVTVPSAKMYVFRC